jgi:aminomethyltransferase
MNLYGQDMDETVSPLERRPPGRWTSRTTRRLRRSAALRQRPANQRPLGLILEDKGVLRSHQKVFTAQGEGETTSGSFSPSPREVDRAGPPAARRRGLANPVEVDIRGKRLKRARQAAFVRNGKAIV